MLKKEYSKKISEKLGVPQILVNSIVDEFINELSETLSNKDKVCITNFGTFQKSYIQAKNQFSPIDGSKAKTNSYYRISFVCSKELIKKLKKE